MLSNLLMLLVVGCHSISPDLDEDSYEALQTRKAEIGKLHQKLVSAHPAGYFSNVSSRCMDQDWVLQGMAANDSLSCTEFRKGYPFHQYCSKAAVRTVCRVSCKHDCIKDVDGWQIRDDDGAVDDIVTLLGYKVECDLNPDIVCGCQKLLSHPELWRSKERMCNADMFFPWACPYTCQAFEPYGGKLNRTYTPNRTLIEKETDYQDPKTSFQLTYGAIKLVV